MIYDEMKNITKDYRLFPDERIKQLQEIDTGGVWFAGMARDEHVGFESIQADAIELALGMGSQKFIITVCGTADTHPYAFTHELNHYVKKFNWKLFGNKWSRDHKYIRGYVSVESLSSAFRKVPIHAAFVVHISEEGGKKPVPEVRAAAKYAAQYPKSRNDLFSPRRVHVKTIRVKRSLGETFELAQKRTAKYFTKTLCREANLNVDHGPGLYVLDEFSDEKYELRKIV